MVSKIPLLITKDTTRNDLDEAGNKPTSEQESGHRTLTKRQEGRGHSLLSKRQEERKHSPLTETQEGRGDTPLKNHRRRERL